MAVNLPNPGTYYAQLGNDIVALRDAMNNLLRDSNYLAAMGGAAFLEAPPFSLNVTDAANVANLIGQVTSGNATVTAVLNFCASAVALTGGQ